MPIAIGIRNEHKALRTLRKLCVFAVKPKIIIITFELRIILNFRDVK